MKKGAFLAVLLFTILIANLALAANDTFVEKAYSCLESRVKDKCSSLPFEEQAFSMLAAGDAYNCKTSLLALSKNSGECWPSSSCRIKDTSIAILALNKIGYDTSKAENWVAKNNITPSDLEWYLEIDSASATSCTISYDSKNIRISIGDDKKISSFSDACLLSSFDSNWLKISQSCLKKKYTISCDKDFLSTILYKKPGSNVWRVSSTIQQATAKASTEHQINLYCYSVSTACNYEDNLWAALALKSAGKEVSGMSPYLLALSDDNLKFFPESFLYILISSDEYLQSILSYQNNDGYWNINNQKFFSTALALLALPDSDAETSAKTWLEENQDSSGCWGGVRDTAFLLYSGWPQEVSSTTSGDTEPDCEVAGNYFCITPGQCDEVDGDPLPSFSCQGRAGIKICCNKNKEEQTCSDMNGEECLSSQTCSLETVPASDTDDCCKGECIEQSETSECEQNSGFCLSSCSSSQEEAGYNCNSGKICCKNSVNPSPSLWWLWILIILIILVVLAIIFRNQLRLFIFKFKNRGKSGQEPVNKTRPPFFPPSQPSRPIFRPFVKPSSTKTDKDLDETFRKLRDMSK